MRSDTGYRVAQFILGVTRSMIVVFVVFGMAISMSVRADVQASNGVIHVIDQVLLPELPAN